MNKDVTYFPAEGMARAVREFETPFFLYDEARIRENCRRFSGAFKNHFPDFWPLYAVKANPNPELLKIIHAEGFDMDASSEAEVYLCDKLGMRGMYTGNYTPAKTLAYAQQNGFMLNLDDVTNLDSFSGPAALALPDILSFRINPGIGKSTMKDSVFAGPDAKYGIPHEEAAGVYARAKDLGVKRFGIHMMTGSNVPISEKDYFAKIVTKLLETVATIKEMAGVEIELLNMGGGFGVPYHEHDASLDVPHIAASVKEAYDAACSKLKIKPPRLMAEPGRFIAADAGWLVGKVTIIKESYKKFAGLDCSTNDMPRPAFYDAYHFATILDHTGAPKTAPESEKEAISIVGTVCENNDQFARDRLLPKIEIGDFALIHNSGGHGRAMGHNYNGKLRSSEYLLETSGKIRQIRRAETFDDLYATVKL